MRFSLSTISLWTIAHHASSSIPPLDHSTVFYVYRGPPMSAMQELPRRVSEKFFIVQHDYSKNKNKGSFENNLARRPGQSSRLDDATTSTITSTMTFGTLTDVNSGSMLYTSTGLYESVGSPRSSYTDRQVECRRPPQRRVSSLRSRTQSSKEVRQLGLLSVYG